MKTKQSFIINFNIFLPSRDAKFKVCRAFGFRDRSEEPSQPPFAECVGTKYLRTERVKEINSASHSIKRLPVEACPTSNQNFKSNMSLH